MTLRRAEVKNINPETACKHVHCLSCSSPLWCRSVCECKQLKHGLDRSLWRFVMKRFVPDRYVPLHRHWRYCVNNLQGRRVFQHTISAKEAFILFSSRSVLFCFVSWSGYWLIKMTLCCNCCHSDILTTCLKKDAMWWKMIVWVATGRVERWGKHTPRGCMLTHTHTESHTESNGTNWWMKQVRLGLIAFRLVVSTSSTGDEGTGVGANYTDIHFKIWFIPRKWVYG